MRDLVEGNFLHNASGLLPFRRKNVKSPVTKPCVGLVTPGQAAASQSQSLFFTQLPPEVRALIYAELLRGAASVVHIVKKIKKRVDYVKCKGKCSMEYNFKCQAGTEDGNNGGTLLLLRTCQKAHLEATPTLYTLSTFDFRSFDAFIILSLIALPQTWNSIRKLHLKWHFGYRLWCGHEDQRLKDDPVWMKVWEIMAKMTGLTDIQVDLDAYLEDGVLSAGIEAEVFKPLLGVRQAGRFDVRVTWPGRTGREGHEVREEPFRLMRITKEANRNIVKPTR
ncbi:hypothetical protein ABVK25_000657 [Lepraria finkii]|uniref:DUF7730 domain-containing protein n=1 Tax=Lepraria finkii TaxID=1340010 RepID=A0ABR4BNI9_9LECA